MFVLVFGTHYLVKYLVGRRNDRDDVQYEVPKNNQIGNGNQNSVHRENTPILGEALDALQVAIRQYTPGNSQGQNQQSNTSINAPAVVTNIRDIHGISNINSPNMAFASGTNALAIAQLVQIIMSQSSLDAQEADRMRDSIFSSYKVNFENTYPVATDENFRLRLAEVFEKPIISDPSNNSVANENSAITVAKRTLLEGTHGSGRTTLMRKCCWDLASGNALIFNVGNQCRFLALCDLSKIANELEKDGLENYLIRLFHEYSASSDVESTKNVLKTYGEETFIFLNGYENLAEELKKKVNSFFERHPDNVEFPSVFARSTICLALSTDALNATSEMFRQSFDRHLIIRGLSKESRFRLIKRVLEQYGKRFDSFETWLTRYQLSFLLDISVFTIVYTCYSYIRNKMKNRYELLNHLISTTSTNYLRKYKRSLTQLELKNAAQTTIRRIAQTIFEKRFKAMDSLSEEYFDKSDLKMAIDLGWITRDCGGVIKVSDPMFLKYFVVKYMNTEFGALDLGDSLHLFLDDNRINFTIITSGGQGNSTLKYIFLTSPGEIFTFVLSKIDDDFKVWYHIYEDFLDLTSDTPPCFTIKLEKRGSIDKKLFEKLERLSPLNFDGEHFLIAAAQILHATDFSCSILFPLEHDEVGLETSALDLEREETVFNYDLDMDIEESKVALSYSALLPIDDIGLVAGFISGMNQLLSLWPVFSNFELTKVHLRLNQSNLKFANICTSIAFGPTNDRPANSDLVSFLNYWVSQFETSNEIVGWTFKVGDLPIKSNAIYDLNAFSTSDPIHLELLFKGA